ncbi:BON domain-containing protein [Micromonospora orduensis]|uniref:BON domain-containing protein n=1 Tax=Micromonospora orduensis TaxID=1420891 RepID=A0A5C4QPB1_9ACTN|nr:BON domain-containing protein [Micromonospora orduensis]TNH28651.1 BON domain-containing protein [Micromonospora orduensis]
MTYPWFFPDDSPPRYQTVFGSDDTRLAWQLLDRMHQNPLLRRESICIEVQNHVVILEGSVSRAEAVVEASRLAWDTRGVYDVNNRLRRLDG